jgi:trehalose 2-sulfotransferase
MIPDYHFLSSYLADYEKQINSIYATINVNELQPHPNKPLIISKKLKQAYFICFINRSGSSLLAEALTKTRRMGHVGEMFNPEPIKHAFEKHQLQSFTDYLDWQIQKSTTRNGVFGAKVGMHQLAYLAKHGYLASRFPEAKFIYVTRQDILMQAVSLYKAWQSGAWSSQIKQKKTVEFDYLGIATQLREIVAAQTEFEVFFASHGIMPLRLTYEGIENNLLSSLRRVCRFVGILRPNLIELPELKLEKQRTMENEEWAAHFRNLHIKQIQNQNED